MDENGETLVDTSWITTQGRTKKWMTIGPDKIRISSGEVVHPPQSFGFIKDKYKFWIKVSRLLTYD